MNIKRPIRRYIPKKAVNKLNSAIETTGTELEKERFFYILDLITRIPTWNRDIIDEYDGYIPFDSVRLRKMIGSNTQKKKYNYKAYLGFLIEQEIIESDNHYITTVQAEILKIKRKSIGYKFAKRLSSKLEVVFIPPKHNLAKRIIEDRLERIKIDKKYLPFVKEMRSRFKKIKFDYVAAIDWIDNNIKDESKRNYNTMALYAIRDRYLFFGRNNTNYRIDSNLTNLKGELKNFLIGDYYHIDLKNSQPLLFNFLIAQIFPVIIADTGEFRFKNRLNEVNDCFNLNVIDAIRKKKIYKTKGFEQERLKFHNWTMHGLFYDKFSKEGNFTRVQAKEVIFKIFFSKNFWYDVEQKKVTESYPEFRIFFKNSFPIIHELIKDLKKKDYKKFSVYLQTLESEIFIDRISKELVTNGIVPLTIHDSFIIEKKDKLKTAQLSHNILQEYFVINPKFEVKEIYNFN